MNPMNVMALILVLFWLLINSIVLGLLRASLNEFFRTAKEAKELQDKTNEAMQEFLKQINKDIDELQARVAKIEKENKG